MHLPIACRPLRRKQVVPDISASRFPPRTHALDALQPSHNRFGNFYFSTKIMIFQDFQEIHSFGHFRPVQAIPGWSAAARSMSAGRAREAAGSVRGVAAGGPEAGGLLGMLSVMSIPIPMSSRGPQTDFPKIRKRPFRCTYWPFWEVELCESALYFAQTTDHLRAPENSSNRAGRGQSTIVMSFWLGCLARQDLGRLS